MPARHGANAASFRLGLTTPTRVYLGTTQVVGPVAGDTAPAQPTVTGGLVGTWGAIFTDEFNTATLDPLKWTQNDHYEQFSVAQGEGTKTWLRWPYDIQQFESVGGVGVFKARRRQIDAGQSAAGADYPFTGVSINTQKPGGGDNVHFAFPPNATTFTQVKFLMDAAKGTWVAPLWTLGTGTTWPAVNEIDPVEIFNSPNSGLAGGVMVAGIHCEDSSGATTNDGHYKAGTYFHPLASSAWNRLVTVGMYRSPEACRLYIDGALVKTWLPADVLSGSTATIPVSAFTDPQILLLDMKTGGDGQRSYQAGVADWTDAELANSDLKIEYMRVWQRSDAGAAPRYHESFEGGTGGWTVVAGTATLTSSAGGPNTSSTVSGLRVLRADVTATGSLTVRSPLIAVDHTLNYQCSVHLMQDALWSAGAAALRAGRTLQVRHYSSTGVELRLGNSQTRTAPGYPTYSRRQYFDGFTTVEDPLTDVTHIRIDVTITGATAGDTFLLDSCSANPTTIGAGSVVVPAQVTGLVVNTVSTTSATAAWNATPNATSYLVERRLSPAGTFASVGTPTSTSLSMTGLAAGTAYDVRVSAVNVAGTGLASALATFTTTGASVVTVVDEFTGTNGAAVSAVTWVTQIQGAGSITINTNKARLLAALNYEKTTLESAAAFGRGTVSVEGLVLFTGAHLAAVGVATVNPANEPFAFLSPTGYSVKINRSVSEIQLIKTAAGTETILATATIVFPALGAGINIDVAYTASGVSAFVWATGAARPAAQLVSADVAYTSGEIRLTNQGEAVATTVDIDRVTWTSA